MLVAIAKVDFLSLYQNMIDGRMEWSNTVESLILEQRIEKKNYSITLMPMVYSNQIDFYINGDKKDIKSVNQLVDKLNKLFKEHFLFKVPKQKCIFMDGKFLTTKEVTEYCEPLVIEYFREG
jgi:hypothetical protein